MASAFLKMKIVRLTPARMIVLGFVMLILLGALLLCLPVSSNDGRATSFTDSLFTSVSAVCVTGLVVVDTNLHWSVFGKAVILLLIQAGALGIMSVTSFFLMIAGKKVGLTQRLALKDSLSGFSREGLVSLLRRIVAFTFLVEGMGTFLTAFALVPVYGFFEGVARSLFHAVSAFCNAGFDLFGTQGEPFRSLTPFRDNGYMLLVTALLIILGGLGYMVVHDVVSNRRFSRLMLHTKIVLIVTAGLLLAGALGYGILESRTTLKDLPFPIKAANAFFSSATARTAGFNSLQMADMSEGSSLLTIVLMFIGAAPGSTAGGVKVTTVFVIGLIVWTYLRGRDEPQAFKRRIGAEAMGKAVSIMMLAILLILISTGVLLSNPQIRFLQALFESTSAFGTVGLSLGITPDINWISKYQLMIVMLVGRIGPLTMVAAFLTSKGQDSSHRYPEGQIMVG